MGTEMERIQRFTWTLAFAILIMGAAFSSGCRKSDADLIKTSSYGNSENNIGTMFEHFDLFLSRSWAAMVDSSGRHYVIFTARIPTDLLLKAASSDTAKWLSVEKKYSAAVFPSVRFAYARITFLITSPATFELGDIRLGISSGTKTVWSPDLMRREKEDLMIAIYRKSPKAMTILGRYANPSFRVGSTLYAKLTGKVIDNEPIPPVRHSKVKRSP
jgi:hypothetical protein